MAHFLLTPWKESLELLRPKNLSLLLLVSLKSLVQMYGALLSVWFIPILFLLAGLLLDLQSLVLAFYIMILAKAARPSVLQKGPAYWQQFEGAEWVLFFGLVILLQWPMFFSVNKLVQFGYNGFLRLLLLVGRTWLPGSGSLGILIPYISPFSILWVLFMLDARRTVGEYFFAFFRALTMFFTNYPFFILAYLVTRLIISLAYLSGLPFTYETLPFIGWILLYGILIPYYVCVITNVYTKRIHEQFSLYYRR